MTRMQATSLLTAVLASAFTSLIAQNNSSVPAVVMAAHVSPDLGPAERTAMVMVGMDGGGSADPSAILRMWIMFSRSAEQQAALDKYEAELLDRSSAHYEKWLTPEQYGRLYGTRSADIATAVAWLESHGFRVDSVPASRTNLSFSGTVHQVEEAFQTSLRSYQFDGQQFYAPARYPVIPESLRGAVAGIAGLNTFRAVAAHRIGPVLAYDPEAARWEIIAAPSTALEHNWPTISSFLAVTPSDAATVYNAPNPVLNANAKSRPAYTGRGVAIGVVGDSAIRASMITKYRARFLGDNQAPTITNIDGVNATNDADQAYIDTELAGAFAPGASIHFYTATNLFDAIQRAISENSVDVLSVGFSACRDTYGEAERQLIRELWAQAAAQGIAVTTPARSASACHGADGGANVFAETAYNIAVGGTDTRVLANGFSSYVKASSSPTRFYGLTTSHIPESAWSDPPSTEEPSAIMQTKGKAIGTESDSGRDGAEDCALWGLLYSCKGTPKPSWQRGLGVPEDGVRDVPDVALLSGHGAYGTAWGVCTDGPPGAGSAGDCTLQADGRFSLHTFGGASTATSAFAGILALVQEKTGGRLGQAAAEIYRLYNGPNSAKIFYRGMAGDSFSSTGADASDGYDLVIGLGSVDVTELVKYWGTAVGSGASTVAVTPSAPTVSSVAGFTVSVTVTGTGSLGTPTGSVVLQSGSFNSGTQALSGGSFTFHIVPGAIAVGTETLTVSYSGDTNYATATGTATVTVTQTTPTVTVTPSTHTLNSNATLSVVATVAGGGGVVPTGTVTLSGGGYTSPAQTLGNGTFTFVIPPFSLAAGSDVLSVSYTGDSLYAGAAGSTTVTVTRSAFTLTATDLSIAAGATTNNASHVTVTPTGSYTGTVALTATVTAAPAGAVSAPTFTGTSVAITSGPATGFITVATTVAPATRRGPLARANGWFGAAGTTAIAAFLFWLSPGGKRRWRVGVSSLMLFACVGFLAMGCGGGSKKLPTVTVVPSQASIKATDALSVTIKVAGTGSASPTGTVVLTSGSFTTSGTLSGGSVTLSIPANTLTAGQANTLTATYSGDNHYLTASGNATVSVAAPGTTPGTYAVTVTGTGNDAGNTTATATFTLTVR